MKEEILRMIEFLEDKYLTVSQCIHSDEAKLNNHNVTLVIKALQEQLDRLEGCAYCHHCCNCRYSTNGKDGEHCICCEIKGIKLTRFEPRNYCSNCGKKLRGREHE